MEKNKFSLMVITSTFNRDIRGIEKMRDLYPDDINEVDISNLIVNRVIEHKENLEWAISNPEYDFNSIYKTDFTNSELLNFFKIYYEYVILTLESYEKKEFIIKLNELA